MPDRKSIVQVKFRLRKDILRQLERSAKAYDRSVNAEIAHRLERSLQGDPDLIRTIVKATIERMAEERGAVPDDAPGRSLADLVPPRGNPDEEDKS
jgi:Arc-like DNA binding domain